MADLPWLAMQPVLIASYGEAYPLQTGRRRVGLLDHLRVIERNDDFDYIHGLIADLLTVFEANPHIDCSAPLLAMYARMNCGLHRRQLLTLLHERNKLPPSILPELQFDSYDEVRALYRKIEREHRLPH